MNILTQTKLQLLNHAPKLLMLLALCLGFITVPLPGIADFMPLFLFMIAFYWSIYFPDYLPYWFLFIIGILQDVLYGEILGFSSLLLILLSGFVRQYRRFFVNKGFIILWIYFGLLVGLYEIGRLTVFSFVSSYGYLLETSMQWLLSVAFYPCIHFLCVSLLNLAAENKKRYAK